jgi:hypothetical protein
MGGPTASASCRVVVIGEDSRAAHILFGVRFRYGDKMRGKEREREKAKFMRTLFYPEH